MNIEQLKAARDDFADAFTGLRRPEDRVNLIVKHHHVISTLLDQAINAPDLYLKKGLTPNEVKEQLKKHFDNLEFGENPNAYQEYGDSLPDDYDENDDIESSAPDLLEVLKEANAELNRRNSYDVQYKTTSVLVNVQKAIKDYGERKC
jgi:hypothetical protein